MALNSCNIWVKAYHLSKITSSIRVNIFILDLNLCTYKITFFIIIVLTFLENTNNCLDLVTCINLKNMHQGFSLWLIKTSVIGLVSGLFKPQPPIHKIAHNLFLSSSAMVRTTLWWKRWGPPLLTVISFFFKK